MTDKFDYFLIVSWLSVLTCCKHRVAFNASYVWSFVVTYRQLMELSQYGTAYLMSW